MHEKHVTAVEFFLHVAQFDQNIFTAQQFTVQFWQGRIKEHDIPVVVAVLYTDARVFTLSIFFFSEKLSSAKEENLGMHQVLDQTLQELNSL